MRRFLAALVFVGIVVGICWCRVSLGILAHDRLLLRLQCMLPTVGNNDSEVRDESRLNE